jgi:hypothetical protein
MEMVSVAALAADVRRLQQNHVVMSRWSSSCRGSDCLCLKLSVVALEVFFGIGNLLS